jgi:hypothetical protein
VCLTLAFVQTEWGQNWLARKATTRLSRDLQSRIFIKHISVGFFNKLNLEGVLVEDQKQDTLLYAGIVQVRITDWFFLKDEAVLNYIGLENAVINLTRTDSVWNYKYLEDYFATPSSPQKKEAGIRFNLKEVVLNNVALNQRDGWRGEDMIVKVGSLALDAKNLDLSDKVIDINSLELVRPYFHLYSYDGRRPSVFVRAPAQDVLTTDTLLQWNPQSWKMNIGRLHIAGGLFRSDQDSLNPTVPYFDGAHIAFGDIDAEFKAIALRNDTLRAGIRLATKERSGLHVQALNANLQLHPQLMEFSNLELKTPNSRLGNYFAMKYKDMSAMSDFIHAVTMQATFSKAHVASDDLAYFAPDLKTWKRTVRLDGKARGTVDALSGRQVSIGIGSSTSFFGDFSLIGLPDINKTFIDVTANNLVTNYTDAATFVPALRSVTVPDISKLGIIRFNGSYTGFINDFVTFGTIRTALGTLSSDLNMKLPENGPPVYSGKVSTDNFNLGSFLRNRQLGTVSFAADVKGRSFDWNNLDVTFNGRIRKFYFNGYTYQNIAAKGTLKKQVFDGHVESKDENADLTLNGLIDLSGKTPHFDAVTNIRKLDLQALHFSKEPVSLSGTFNLKFNGRSLSDFVGNARFGSITFSQGGRELKLDSLQLTSSFKNGVRTLQAQAPEFNATITGNFDLATLPDAVTLFLSRYYPSYIKPPTRRILKQDFTFDIKTGEVEEYVKLFDSRLSGFNNSHIQGSLDVAASRLTLEGDVPYFSFNQYRFSNTKLNGDGDFTRLLLTGQVNDAVISDSLYFPETTFRLEAQNDVTDFNINTTASQTINQANLSAQIKTFSDGASVLFNPSTVVINGKTWTIEQGGELDLRMNAEVQGQLVLRESVQEIRVFTQPSSIGDWNDLHVSLRNINIGDFSPFFLPDNRAEGILHGDIVVEDPIGQMQASLFYNNSTGMLTGRGGNTDLSQKVTINLALDLKDSANLFQNRISIGATNYPVKILERFLGALFSDMQGYVTGNLDIVGEGADMAYLGKARLRNAGMKVNFTQVFYNLDDTEIELTETAIKLGNITLRDRYNHTATVRGTIQHKAFQEMTFDIVAEVDKEPMELLNTTYNDNQQFYGRARGTGSFILIGPLNDLFMQINGRASEQDSSYITLPPSKTRESGAASFLVEKKYGTEQEEIVYSGAATNITYEVNLAANPMVNVEVILDDLTGDVIRGRGTGNIELRAGTVEPLSIRGRYAIQEGSYLFTFQSFFKKPFVLRKNGNNYIEWTGDPYAATIRFEAGYQANDVSLAPLASRTVGLNDNSNNNLARYRGDVTVVATLTGELFRPTFDFKIEFPENFYTAMDQRYAFEVQQAIQQIERNTNELNKQVTYLIVFNSFAPFENSGTTVNPLNEFAYSTISGLFFGEVNKRLNQLLSKILRNNDLTVNFTGSLYNSDPVPQTSRAVLPNQSNLNINVGLPLMKERLLVTLGSTFDIPLQSNQQQSFQLLPDVMVEFLINKSGTIRATFFYRQTPDYGAIANNQTQRAGANLAYRRDFNSLSEFLLNRKKGNRKNQKQPDPAAAPVDSTSTTVAQ